MKYQFLRNYTPINCCVFEHLLCCLPVLAQQQHEIIYYLIVNIVYAYIPITFFYSVERVRSGAGRDGEAMGCLYVYIDKIEFIVQLFFKKRIKVVKIFKRVSTFLISSRNIMAMFLFNIYFSLILINAFLCVNVLKHERKGLKGLFCIF